VNDEEYSFYNVKNWLLLRTMRLRVIWIFLNSNYTRPVKWGTLLLSFNPGLSCCFLWVRYGVKTRLACTVALDADIQWSKMLTVCNAERVKLDVLW